MSNQNTRVLRSLVVLTRGDLQFYSVGRAIRNPHRFRLAMTATGPNHDYMGRWLGSSYGFDACAIALEAGTDAELKEAIASLRATGLVSEEEAKAARPRAEKYRALVSTLRTAGLRVTIRNADECGETRRLTITGNAAERAEFMSMCSVEQAEWVKATFVAVEGRDDARSGVISIVD